MGGEKKGRADILGRLELFDEVVVVRRHVKATGGAREFLVQKRLVPVIHCDVTVAHIRAGLHFVPPTTILSAQFFCPPSRKG